MSTQKKYKVWYIPQVPMPAFEVETDSLKEAIKIKDIIEKFSAFEFDNRIKPDYSDASGISEWDEDEQEWWDVDEYEIEQSAAMEQWGWGE